MGKNGFRILDSDLHVLEPHDLYTKYMDSKWGNRVPRGQPRSGSGSVDFRTADGSLVRSLPEGYQFPTTAKQEDQRFAVGAERDFDPVSQMKAMDIEGIDVAVLFRTFPLFTDDSLEPEYAIALCRAWNDWITDFCKEGPERMKAAGIVALHDADLAAQEIRRSVTELEHIGECLTSYPTLGRQLPEPYFDPVWAETEQLGVPLCFHPASLPNQPSWANDFIPLDGYSWLARGLAQPLENLRAVTYFTACGILERFPKLQVAFLEGNCSWLPWLLYRLDERYSMWESAKAVTKLSIKPSEYFRRQCFISTDVDEYLVKDVIEHLGDDNLVFSTDYPHDDCAFPEATDSFLAMEGVSDDSKRKILWDNCARLYNLN